MRLRIIFISLGLIFAVAGVLIGIGLAGGTSSSSGRLKVVAAENVYGDIARQIGGAHVAMTSILSDPNADPHLFEPGTSAGLAVSTAAVVIQNGLGYDSFMTRLEAAAPASGRIELTVADVLGIHGADANPHLWYDAPRIGRVASAIGDALARADPTHRAAYAAGVRRFEARFAPVVQTVARIRASSAGRPVAYTEPVPGYLIAAAGLRNLTPSSFARAVETGSEPAPQAVADMTALLRGHRVDVLFYNSQTVTPITVRLETAARGAGVAIVPVRETLPPGQTFQAWQLAQARALLTALSR
ncbi:MAG: zinc/manganese transport system substrate-binding protein [Gaiellaceae bacterium]|jgi:zinc/manganese transport system substrate-binding protein|nr:zinc/manganese transport system substrate-binding protein [Gaiellaceae bacterium]